MTIRPRLLRTAILTMLVSAVGGCSSDDGSGTREAVSPVTGSVAVGAAAERNDLTVTPVSIPTPARAGRQATATFRTRPGNSCQMEVRDGAADEGHRLPPVTANSDGIVSWTWKVSDDASRSTLTAVVTCSGGTRGNALITVA